MGEGTGRGRSKSSKAKDADTGIQDPGDGAHRQGPGLGGGPNAMQTFTQGAKGTRKRHRLSLEVVPLTLAYTYTHTAAIIAGRETFSSRIHPSSGFLSQVIQ